MLAKVLNENSPYLQQGDCLLKKCGTKGFFVVEHDKIPNNATKQRQEHFEHLVPIGEWFVDRVNEYDHAKEESRKLVD